MSRSRDAFDELLEDVDEIEGMHGEIVESTFKKLYKSPYYNICLLALAWAATLTTSTLLTTVGPLSVSSLGASDSVATFSIGIFLIGAALSSVPSGWLFSTLGRKRGFLIGCAGQVVGSSLGGLGLHYEKVWVVLMGCLFVGFGQGIGQFYRFSATEMTPDELKPRAVTYVLAGGVIAAFLGPISATYSVDFFSKPYQGSYAACSIIGLGNALIVLMVRFTKLPGEQRGAGVVPKTPQLNLNEGDNMHLKEGSRNSNARDSKDAFLSIIKRRPLKEIIKQPLFIVSCIIPTVAHTLMVMLMSSVTLAMDSSGYSFQQAALVMELHFLAMFGPGFITGMAIQRFGTLVVSVVGGVFFASACLVMILGEDFYSYTFGMALCGIGWNLSFSAGTVMLMSSYEPEEATYVQAFNDFVLFTTAGSMSLVSGLIFKDYGWLVLVYVVSVFVLLNMGFFVFAWRLKAVLDAAASGETLYEAIAPGAKQGYDEDPSDNEDNEGESSPNHTRNSVVSESGWWRRVDSETGSIGRTWSESSERQLSTEGSHNLSLRTPVA